MEKGIKEDYYFKNPRKIEVDAGRETVLRQFCIDEDETLDFLAVVSSSSASKDEHNDLRLNLYQDGRKVVTSIDDGDKGSDDNSSLALHYKTQVRDRTCFALKAKATWRDREIPASQLQVGYKTYGRGHELSMRH